MYSHNNSRRQDGFSLLELLISMSVMLIILGTVFSLMGGAVKMSATTFETTDAQQSLRIAQEYINRDLDVAGSGLNGIPSGNIQVPSTFVKKWITANPVGEVVIAGNANANYVPLPLVIADDIGSTPPTGTNAPPAGLLANSDRTTMLVVDPDSSRSANFPVTVAAGNITKPNANQMQVNVGSTNIGFFKAGEIYFFNATSSGGTTNAAFGTITSISGNNLVIDDDSAIYGLNLPGLSHLTNVVFPGAVTTSVATSILPVNIVTYYVGANKLLYRQVFGGQKPNATMTIATFATNAKNGTVVADHITNAQFRYYTYDKSLSNPWQVSDTLTATQQPQVRQLEATITAETVHPVNNNTNTQITTTVRTSLRNLQFRSALGA